MQEGEVDEFNLKSTTLRTSKQNMLLVVGDWNWKLEIMRECSWTVWPVKQEAGERLTNFCQSNDFFGFNNQIDVYMWTSPDGSKQESN